ncbi:2-C-methyl-D-erythritol 4-phosphate cytidylyltransferase [Thalassotalea marina]|uniref:2-C-methyl-D-erythritol 4-phosphate cytidylyltransferase n=1 Tax=Thalassotalea marina TaxID=1673741 RepID=A0A919BER9_9GAMM|nr:2-C-methyl-D-erythritol 4-phosphate cytidylyltransferase [Thalassotalea marina]GHF85808.1 2-C-methyl-D-erythritol 4-phosphate cytidylyltransferase [Thalassotalea marina]
MPSKQTSIVAIVPAAGVGKRMQINHPKQYLTIGNQTILEHTVETLLTHPQISKVIIAISAEDEYFQQLPLNKLANVQVVEGGEERVHSVLNGIKAIDTEQTDWVLVHDAARPCLTHQDITKLIDSCLAENTGGILATPVRDTMKRGVAHGQQVFIKQTEEREQLWHALTPQFYPLLQLKNAIEFALSNEVTITDEASAIEYSKHASLLIEGRGDNIKVTRPDDLSLAEFILHKQEDEICA